MGAAGGRGRRGRAPGGPRAGVRGRLGVGGPAGRRARGGGLQAGAGGRPVAELNAGIASFYDQSSGLWEDMWGEHMHHGYYPQGKFRADHRQAQVDMVDRVLEWAGVDEAYPPSRTVDVGCGIGGSSRHIAQKYGSSGAGITLSPKQAERANALSAAAGLGERLNFQVADALQQPFQDGSFDLAWSLESGEHMPDKCRFFGELARVTAPGGRIIIVTWCHRELAAGEDTLPAKEQKLLDDICRAYYLPAWVPISEYRRIAEELGLEDIRVDDWSQEVSPFWAAVIQTALSRRGLVGLLRAGWSTLKGALVMPLMARGLKSGTIKFNLITAVKPK